MQDGRKWEEMMKNEYLLQLIAQVEKRNPGEPEFHQAVREVFSSLEAGRAGTSDLVWKQVCWTVWWSPTA